MMRGCPLAWWACVYFTGIPMLDFAARWGLHGASRPIALVSVLCSVSAAALVLEVSRKRLGDCVAFLHSPLQRVALYAISFIVGLFVVYPALSVSREITPAFRVVGAIGIVSVLGALGWHWKFEHRDQPIALTSGTRALLWLTRLPFLLLGLAGGILLIVAVGEVVYTALGH